MLFDEVIVFTSCVCFVIYESLNGTVVSLGRFSYRCVSRLSSIRILEDTT